MIDTEDAVVWVNHDMKEVKFGRRDAISFARSLAKSINMRPNPYDKKRAG
jgi:hypothetical protein